MGIRVYRPRNSSLRKKTGFDFKEITKKDPEKSLTKGLMKKSARNNYGRITVRRRGGGHKRLYRVIDFKRTKTQVPARVASIEYDPNRGARIALLHYLDGEKAYILAPIDLKKGDQVVSGKGADVRPGHCLKLADIPLGMAVHNVEIRPGKGGQMVRGAGSQAVIAAKLGKYCQVKMPSGEVRQVLSECRASIGQVSNTDVSNLNWGKAGKSRWKGKRPSVRGMAMNPIDHPMGGGEGVGKGNHPMTPWGKSCKGLKTRNNKRTQSMIIKARSKRKKR